MPTISPTHGIKRKRAALNVVETPTPPKRTRPDAGDDIMLGASQDLPVSALFADIPMARTAKATLQTMPYEIIEQIAKDADDLAARAYLSRASSALHMGIGKALLTTFANKNANSLRQFLSLILRNPKLRNYVEKADLAPWMIEKEAYAMRDQFTPLSAADRELFVGAAKWAGLIPQNMDTSTIRPLKDYNSATRMDRDEDFLRLIQNGVDDGLVLLLLAVCPNLRHLSVRLPIRSRLYWGRLLDTKFGLANIEHLEIHGSEQNGLFVWPDFAPMLRLPSLETFKTSWCIFRNSANGTQPRRTKLRHIELLNCCVSGPAIRPLLASTKVLETFKWSMTPHSKRDREKGYVVRKKNISLHKILEALQCNLETLHHLSLVGFHKVLKEQQQDAYLANGVLAQFPYLESFESDFTVLTGTEDVALGWDIMHVLPDTLKTLRIRKSTPDAMNHLKRVLFEKEYHGYLPLLEKIEVHAKSVDTWSKLRRREVWSEASRQGVRLEYFAERS